jgi:hypothetical protein
MKITCPHLEIDTESFDVVIRGQLFNGFSGRLELPSYATVREIWKAEADCISRKFILRLKDEYEFRSGWLKILIPYPAQQSKLKIWSAHRRFPEDLYHVGGLHLYYGDACYGTLIPSVTLYEPERNIGLTVSKAFGRIGGRMSFNFGNYHEEGMEIEFSNLALIKGKDIEIELLMRGHDGCWRPGLKWLSERYPDYFMPPNPAVWKQNGAFAITNPFSNSEFLKRHKLNWVEVHNHFPHYGDYAPEATEWNSVVLHDYPELSGEIPSKISPSLINSHISNLHRQNIKAMMYFQCGGDAFIPWAEEHFPESMAKDSAGNLIPTWRECCFMNASENTAFGQFVNRKIDRFLRMYPDMDGVFLDQLCYQSIDYAHSDGKTAAHDQPVAEYGASFEYNLEKLAEQIHDAGKTIWANGPFDIEIARRIDGVMSEGSSGISESHKYLCVRKPLLIHTYPSDIFKAEAMLKYCLLAGASWSFGGSSTLRNPPEFTEEIKALFSEYLPLLEPLLESDILLESDPFRLPPGYKGEIFKSHDGKKLLVTMTGSSCVRILRLQLNIIRQGNALYRGNKDTEWQKLDFHDGTMDLPNNSISYTVIINLQE